MNLELHGHGSVMIRSFLALRSPEETGGPATLMEHKWYPKGSV